MGRYKGVLITALCWAALACINAAPAIAQESPVGSIPLLISDHHADHGVFFLRRAAFTSMNTAAIILVDAHSDTARNENRDRVLAAASAGDFNQADTFFHNHNWIHPLSPFLASLVWISGFTVIPQIHPAGDSLYSSAQWGSGGFPAFTQALNINRLKDFTFPSDRTQSGGQGLLFISIDLDFFYLGAYTQADIPSVFDTLFEYASRWNGEVIWAVCLSRAWLPSDSYAWELLRQSLQWFSGKPEFAPPELTLFTKYRDDQSMMFREFHKRGMEPPAFFGKENEMPDDIRELFVKLLEYPDRKEP